VVNNAGNLDAAARLRAAYAMIGLLRPELTRCSRMTIKNQIAYDRERPRWVAYERLRC
jgi:hypothetical protein